MQRNKYQNDKNNFFKNDTKQFFGIELAFVSPKERNKRKEEIRLVKNNERHEHCQDQRHDIVTEIFLNWKEKVIKKGKFSTPQYFVDEKNEAEFSLKVDFADGFWYMVQLDQSDSNIVFEVTTKPLLKDEWGKNNKKLKIFMK